jgi:hypothetical protein
MPLMRRICSLHGAGYRKLAFEFAAGDHLPHPSKRTKNLAVLEWLETSVNTSEATSMALVCRIHRTELCFYKHKSNTETKKNSRKRMFIIDNTDVTTVRRAYKILVKGGMRGVAIDTSPERVKYNC